MCLWWVIMCGLWGRWSQLHFMRRWGNRGTEPLYKLPRDTPGGAHDPLLGPPLLQLHCMLTGPFWGSQEHAKPPSDLGNFCTVPSITSLLLAPSHTSVSASIPPLRPSMRIPSENRASSCSFSAWCFFFCLTAVDFLKINMDLLKCFLPSSFIHSLEWKLQKGRTLASSQ